MNNSKNNVALDALLKQADELLLKKDFKQAEQLATKVLKEELNNGHAYLIKMQWEAKKTLAELKLNPVSLDELSSFKYACDYLDDESKEDLISINNLYYDEKFKDYLISLNDLDHIYDITYLRWMLEDFMLASHYEPIKDWILKIHDRINKLENLVPNVTNWKSYPNAAREVHYNDLGQVFNTSYASEKELRNGSSKKPLDDESVNKILYTDIQQIVINQDEDDENVIVLAIKVVGKPNLITIYKEPLHDGKLDNFGYAIKGLILRLVNIHHEFVKIVNNVINIDIPSTTRLDISMAKTLSKPTCVNKKTTRRKK